MFSLNIGIGKLIIYFTIILSLKYNISFKKVYFYFNFHNILKSVMAIRVFQENGFLIRLKIQTLYKKKAL